jgi:predicted ATPase
LALQVAQLLFEARANQIDITHGVFFVSLTPIETTGEVVATVAEALSFSFYSHVPPRQQLLDYLRDKRLLLVLDNFEHLLNPTSAGAGDAVQLLSEICAAAPGVTTLVTSREALNIQEAWFHPITEMAFPTEQESGSETASAALLDYDAVQLFMQGAQRARVKFSLADEKDAVLKICRLVGGVPLGIELAASWLKVLPATKIASEIERSLDILSTRLQNLPERHRSMRAVLAYSWQRLTPAEQLVLQRLSVFRGSFTETAAEEVAGASLLTLATLVEKSLLQVRENTRYGMHELLRQFAENQLQASPQEALTARQQHSTYFLEFLQSQQQWFFGTKQKLALAEIAAEIENIRTAWHWSVSQAYLAVLDQAVSSLFQFYELRSRFKEGE